MHGAESVGEPTGFVVQACPSQTHSWLRTRKCTFWKLHVVTLTHLHLSNVCDGRYASREAWDKLMYAGGLTLHAASKPEGIHRCFHAVYTKTADITGHCTAASRERHVGVTEHGCTFEDSSSQSANGCKRESVAHDTLNHKARRTETLDTS